MTAALFPVAMLIVFIIMGVVFCYEPESETDATDWIIAGPRLNRAQQIDRAIEIELHALRNPGVWNKAVAKNVRANTIGA